MGIRGCPWETAGTLCCRKYGKREAFPADRIEGGSKVNEKEKEQEKMMKKLFLEGYSKNAIAEAFECLPETVTARIKRAEEDTNGT